MSKETSDTSFNNDVINSANLVLVDFWAPWCGPCRQLSPTIDDISNQYVDKLKVYKCNVDENPETPSKYGVRGIPCLMLFKDGQLLDTKVGASPKPILLEWINKFI